MPNAKTLIQQCSQTLEASALKELLLPLWRLIEWQSHTADLRTGVELDRSGDAVIHLYPALESMPDAAARVLREFGRFVLLRAAERGLALWKGKLDAPTPEQVQLVKQKLADAALRATCKTYADVLDSYPGSGHSVPRLVYINLTNALLANNISYPDSVGVDILTWGPTTAYAKGEKYHCLVPLVSAYSPADIYEDYGAALAALLTDKLTSVRDASVAYALRGLIQRIARIASPAQGRPS